jgi:hypothetical protein
MAPPFTLTILLIGFLFLVPGNSIAGDKDLSSKPMSFDFKVDDFRQVGLDLFQLIRADGVIAPGTADRLRELAKEKGLIRGGTIYLNSAGGSLVEGMKLGKAIRELGLETYIGDQRKAAYCLSACTLAFLGGVYRSMDNNARYGVHRFYSETGIPHASDLDTAQILSADIVNYIKSMGVDPMLFQLMVLRGKDEVTIIPKTTLEKLNVLNNGISQTKWEITARFGAIYLKGVVTNRRGTHKLIFLCDNGHVELLVILPNPDPAYVVSMTTRESFLINDREVPVSPFQPLSVSNTDVNMTINNLPQDILRMLASANKIGIIFTYRNPVFGNFFTIDKNQNDIDTMTNFFNSCHP